MPTQTTAAFTTVRSEGGLLPGDLLARIVAGDGELGGLGAADYGLAANERLGEVISRLWNDAKTYWEAFKADQRALGADESGVTETRDFVLRLLRELGWGRPEYRAGAEELNGRRYLIQHRSGPVPLHIVSYQQELDRAAAGAGAGAPRLSPHALLQEYLNASDAALYGVVSNGLELRLLRDNASITRLAAVEFDLAALFDNSVYADFVLLYLVLHRSRLPREGQEAGECWLERWRAKAETQGTRALGALRVGVEQAIKALGNGLLSHPANDALRDRLRRGELSTEALYAQLLRLVYRLIFLFVAEERELLFAEGARAAQRQRYTENYGASRLRGVARRFRTDDRHDDLWRSLRVTFDLLAGTRSGLDLVALEGIFAADACADVDAALVGNDALAEAVLQLSNVRVDKRVRRVNYRDIGAEELGGVYEGLLEQQPRVVVAAPVGERFALVGSGQRKSTGSYYTPASLVHELIKSALEPVITDRLARAGEGAAAREQALLSIRVCDSACGSGHFLLAAARRLAAELARVRSAEREPGQRELRAALRDVIRHCIYGVDLNPLAVDLCHLSLWLEGQDRGKPLSFLEHHVKVGNSLVGATPELVAGGIPDGAYDAVGDDDKAVAKRLKQRNRSEQPKRGRGRGVGETQAAYLSGSGALMVDWPTVAEGLADTSRTIDALPDGDVRAAREEYGRYVREQVDPARARLDAWTAAFFWPLKAGEAEPPTTADLRGGESGQVLGLSAAQRAEVQRLREQYRFFHWPLEFPDVFAGGGFDCVLGNPPWERIKLQEQEFFAERDPAIAKAPNKAARQRLIDTLPERDPALARAFGEAKRAAESASEFVRESGRFPLTAVGDVDLYPLFVEHKRAILNGAGRAGVIVPTGIATGDSTKVFFQAVVGSSELASLFGFWEIRRVFVETDSRQGFALLTLSAVATPRADIAFSLDTTDQLRDERRRFQLSAEDFALLNPNTRTCPVFRTRADADLTRAIYRRVPVQVDERRGLNPWGVQFLAMFHMSNDSGLFRDAPGPGLVPLYEAKLFHQFNHRWATYDGADARDATPVELADPAWAVRPRYWVAEGDAEARLRGRWDFDWLLAFRDVARATDERTAIFSMLPRVGVGHKAPLLFARAASGCVAALYGSVNALVFDYVVRQKMGGTSLGYFVFKQLPVLPPSAYSEADLAFIVPRVLELSYTAWDLQPFARDLGYEGPPFVWDEERRALLRAELDATYAALYGLTRDELRYVLDPQDVYGPDFPGETFRVLKEREIKQHGEYRTRRLVLEAWDRLGLEPRNRDGRYEAGEGATGAGSSFDKLTTKGGRGQPGMNGVGAAPESAGPVAQDSDGPLLARQTVRERVRTVAYTPELPRLAEASARPETPVAGTPVEPAGADGGGKAGPGTGTGVGTGPVRASVAQPGLPGLEDAGVDARQRVLGLVLEVLRVEGPQTARELARRLAPLDASIDRHLVNSVLAREGAASVQRDAETGVYRVKA